MVNDDILLVHTSESVSLMVGDIAVAESEAHVSYDDIARRDAEWIVGYANAVARSCLPEYGDVAVLQPQLACQVDSAGDIEDNGAFS